MSKSDKLLARIMARPRDFTYDELKKLLFSFDCIVDNRGKTSGSRVAFIHKKTGLILRLHKPHPNNELKMYQVDEVVKYIQSLEVVK